MATSATSCSRRSARSPVKSLSGGERNRLLLARLFARPANVLVLDRPTNDLDIETLDLLEELLAGYDGTLFLVSHDRAFLDNVVAGDRRRGRRALEQYAGGYGDWQRVQGTACRGGCRARGDGARKRRRALPPAGQGARRRAQGREPPTKLSFNEKRELEGLPERIAAPRTSRPRCTRSRPGAVPERPAGSRRSRRGWRRWTARSRPRCCAGRLRARVARARG